MGGKKGSDGPCKILGMQNEWAGPVLCMGLLFHTCYQGMFSKEIGAFKLASISLDLDYFTCLL